jgi:hypothetical protein
MEITLDRNGSEKGVDVAGRRTGAGNGGQRRREGSGAPGGPRFPPPPLPPQTSGPPNFVTGKDKLKFRAGAHEARPSTYAALRSFIQIY